MMLIDRAGERFVLIGSCLTTTKPIRACQQGWFLGHPKIAGSELAYITPASVLRT